MHDTQRHTHYIYKNDIYRNTHIFLGDFQVKLLTFNTLVYFYTIAHTYREGAILRKRRLHSHIAVCFYTLAHAYGDRAIDGWGIILQEWMHDTHIGMFSYTNICKGIGRFTEKGR